MSLAWLAHGDTRALIEYLPADFQEIPSLPAIQRVKDALAWLTAVPLPPLIKQVVGARPEGWPHTVQQALKWCWTCPGSFRMQGWPQRRTPHACYPVTHLQSHAPVIRIGDFPQWPEATERCCRLPRAPICC